MQTETESESGSVGEIVSYPKSAKVTGTLLNATEVALFFASSPCLRSNRHISQWIAGVWTSAFTYDGVHPTLRPEYNTADLKDGYIELYNGIISNPIYRFRGEIILYRWSNQGSVGGAMPTIVGASPLVSVTLRDFYEVSPGKCCLYVIHWPAGWPLAPQMIGMRAEVVLPPFSFEIVRREATGSGPDKIHIRPTYMRSVEFRGAQLVSTELSEIPRPTTSAEIDRKMRLISQIGEMILDINMYTDDNVSVYGELIEMFLDCDLDRAHSSIGGLLKFMSTDIQTDNMAIFGTHKKAVHINNLIDRHDRTDYGAYEIQTGDDFDFEYEQADS